MKSFWENIASGNLAFANISLKHNKFLQTLRQNIFWIRRQECLSNHFVKDRRDDGLYNIFLCTFKAFNGATKLPALCNDTILYCALKMLLWMKISKLTFFSLLYLFTVASTPENILNKTDTIALRDLSTESTSSSTNVQTEAQSKNGQISSKGWLSAYFLIKCEKDVQASDGIEPFSFYLCRG